MLPRILIGTAPVPGGGELRLFRRGDEFSIMLGANELMNSRLSGSEEALARAAAGMVGDRAAPQVLVGGLGMGFTLRAALEAFGPKAAVTVSELVPAVVEWARGPMAPLLAGALDDVRVAIHVGDVTESMARGGWDAILLDVDNGPDGLTRAGNDRLYDHAGLGRARAALRPGGVLAVWSARPDAAFTRRLRDAGLAVEERTVRAGRGRGARHVVWLARRA